jgi:hypothetical protein
VLLGLIRDTDDIRALGCMGVGAICEFGSTDPDIAALRSKVSPALQESTLEQSSVCVLDSSGKVVRETKVASEPEALFS